MCTLSRSLSLSLSVSLTDTPAHNNDGYTTQPVIHEGPYNDIQRWDYHRLPEVFGGGWGARVTTEDELDAALERARGGNEGPALIELMLERLDTSEALKRIGAALSPDKAPS